MDPRLITNEAAESNEPTYEELLKPLDRTSHALNLGLDIEKTLQITISDASRMDTDTILPDYDRGKATKRLCILGLVFSWLVIIVCIILGPLCITKAPASLYTINLSLKAIEALSFAMNVFIALSTDALGYIHGTSLRWALFRNNRLQFNTNLRLFTSIRNHAPNRWPANLVCLVSLVMCYTASSQLFIGGNVYTLPPEPTSEFISSRTYINGMALLTLGLGLLGKTSIATWIMLSTSKKMITWSSNPMNNTLALISSGLSIIPEKGMVSASRPELIIMDIIKPTKVQPSARSSRRSTLWIIVLSWIWPLWILMWFMVIVLYTRNVNGVPTSWTFSPSWYMRASESVSVRDPVGWNALTISSSTNLGNVPWPVQLFISVLIQCAVKLVQVLGIHAVELVVNVSRDESAWRAAYDSRTGTRMNPNAFLSAALSWENIILLVSKPALHWTLGQTLSSSVEETRWSLHWPDHEPPFIYSFNYKCEMLYMRVLVYSILALALAVFTTFLAYRRPHGPQPAAYGHYQTLGNLIDDWRVDDKGGFWWGDKGVRADGFRQAGTSSKTELLGKIKMDALYKTETSKNR